ncbi:hypothetical protein [Xanthomonas pisi]|uniref:Uncharacterized protein n=1 Tax=Xanthomonas pisi TaxID=56457 RepID=A0A2S7CVM1_9XANT|nr:hypothetical protein [Xanthomonas pisi]PPU65519.1 hypothetical protein XpiCFBP4643_20620 [Xanthomonas pisi]
MIELEQRSTAARCRSSFETGVYYKTMSDVLDLVGAVENIRDDYRTGLHHRTEDRWDTCLYFY